VLSSNEEVQRTLGLEIRHLIPDDPGVVNANNTGIPARPCPVAIC
jgi:hypothetical protein